MGLYSCFHSNFRPEVSDLDSDSDVELRLYNVYTDDVDDSTDHVHKPHADAIKNQHFFDFNKPHALEANSSVAAADANRNASTSNRKDSDANNTRIKAKPTNAPQKAHGSKSKSMRGKTNQKTVAKPKQQVQKLQETTVKRRAPRDDKDRLMHLPTVESSFSTSLFHQVTIKFNAERVWFKLKIL